MKELLYRNFQSQLYTKLKENFSSKNTLVQLTFDEISSNGNNLHPFINVDFIKSYNRKIIFLMEIFLI